MRAFINPVSGWKLAMIVSIASLFFITHSQMVLGADNQPVAHVVEIESFLFSPATLEVNLGDTIVWINKDIVPHTATDIAKQWDTDNLEMGERGEIQVTEKVLGEYFCRFHPAMKGTIVLRTDE